MKRKTPGQTSMDIAAALAPAGDGTVFDDLTKARILINAATLAGLDLDTLRSAVDLRCRALEHIGGNQLYANKE